MPSITVTPNPASAAGDLLHIVVTGLVAGRKTRVKLAGVVISGVTKPISGTVTVDHGIGSTTPETVSCEQCVHGSSWTEVASTSVTIVAPTPGPTPDPSPGGGEPEYADMTGWQLVFHDDFNDRTIAEGAFLNGGNPSPSGSPYYLTSDGRYLVYKLGWKDTTTHGRYDPSIISVHDGYMDIHIQTKTDGIGTWPRVAAMIPKPIGSSARGGLLGMRRHIRARGDLMLHYKGVPLNWADAALTNDDLKLYGEIDWPEASTDDPIHGFMHRTGASTLSDQYTAIPSPDDVSWQDWHDYVIEWIAGTSLKFFVDGVQVGVTQTSRVPSVLMHWVLQFETATGGEPAPDAATSGHFQIDRVGVWVPV